MLWQTWHCTSCMWPEVGCSRGEVRALSSMTWRHDIIAPAPDRTQNNINIPWTSPELQLFFNTTHLPLSQSTLFKQTTFSNFQIHNGDRQGMWSTQVSWYLPYHWLTENYSKPPTTSLRPFRALELRLPRRPTRVSLRAAMPTSPPAPALPRTHSATRRTSFPTTRRPMSTRVSWNHCTKLVRE